MPRETKIDLQSDFGSAKKLFQNWLQMRPTLPIDKQFYRCSTGEVNAHQIRYETMSDDIAAFTEILGVDIDFSKIPNWKGDARQHKGKMYADYYDEKTLKIVQKQFKYDFDKFGYAA